MIDQLVFGYDEGHRLLGGSCTLATTSLSLLLGATDAAPASTEDRLLTGLPIPTERRYALCVTWAAPEAPRPGAVWSHVMLVPIDDLAAVDAFALLAAARRPTFQSIRSFDQMLPMPVGAPSRSQAPIELLAHVTSAAYGQSGSKVVISSDLAAGEISLAAVWQAQWPELRARFSFRTRDTVRESASKADVIVARRVRGAKRQPGLSPAPSWAQDLAMGIADPDGSSPLLHFLLHFGPTDRPEPSTVGALAELFGLAGAAAVDEVRAQVESRHPEPFEGRALKIALFGDEDQTWWTVAEPSRVFALLGSTVNAWDVEALRLADRIVGVLTSDGPERVSEALAAEAASSIRGVTLDALAVRGDPTDVPLFAKQHLSVVQDLTERAPRMFESPLAWQGAPLTAVRSLLRHVSRNPASIAAAVEAGHSSAAAEELGEVGVLEALVDVGSIGAARALLHKKSWRAAISKAVDPSLILLRATAVPDAAASGDVVDALETRRANPDELWLRAAVKAMGAQRSEPRSVLVAAFGPLHRAVTENRLPQDCWQVLDPVLPRANDAALRLRRYLLEVAHREHWPAHDVEMALRDAGPFAGQLLHEFEDSDDEWWLGAMKGILRSLGLRGRS